MGWFHCIHLHHLPLPEQKKAYAEFPTGIENRPYGGRGQWVDGFSVDASRQTLAVLFMEWFGKTDLRPAW